MNVSAIIEKSGAGRGFQLATVVRKELDSGRWPHKQVGPDSSQIWQLATFAGRFAEYAYPVNSGMPFSVSR